MNKKLIIIIIVVGALVLGAWAFMNRNQLKTLTNLSLSPSPAPAKAQNQAKLVFDPETINTASAGAQTTYLAIETSNTNIRQIVARMQYDPKVLSNFRITPPKSGVSILGSTDYTVDSDVNNDGTAFFTITFNSPKTTPPKPALPLKEPLAKITFTVSPSAAGQPTRILFLPGTDILKYPTGTNSAQVQSADGAQYQSILQEVVPATID